MKRTTVMLPDDLATLVELERQKRNASTAEVIRHALESYFGVGATQPKRYSFIGIGDSGHTDTASRIEELLAEEWDPDRDRG